MLFPRSGVHFSARKVDRSGVPLLKSNPIDNRKQKILEFEFHSRCLKICSLQGVKQNTCFAGDDNHGAHREWRARREKSRWGEYILMSGLKLSTRQQGNVQLILSPASVTKLEPYPVDCEITKDSFSVTPRIPSRSIPKFLMALKNVCYTS